MYTILGSDQQTYGPVDAATVRQWIQSGQANAQTQINVQGASDWVALDTLPEFAGDLGLSTPAAPGTRVAPTQAAAPVEGWDVPKTLGILNIVFGVICGVCQGAGIAGVFTMIASFKSAGGNSEAETILTVALGLMAVAMVLLLMQLISGVGLLMKKKWGRTLAIVFALGFILVGIGDLVMEFVLIPDAMSGSSEEIARNIGHTIGKIVRMIYPVILLVFMTKPEVKRVLS